MPDPTGRISHLPDMHRGVAWKEPVRVATASNIAITGQGAGAAIDGVTLATGDRILLKNQTAASSNGIYQVRAAGLAAIRAFDMDQDASSSVPASEVIGAVVQVVAGGSNGGTFWRTTNTTAPAIGTDAINWLHMPMGGAAGAPASVSYGSNATDVSGRTYGGVSPDASRADHEHLGVVALTSSSSNTLQRPTVNLRAGSGIAFGATDSDGNGTFDTLTISTTGSGSGGASPGSDYVSGASGSGHIIIPGLAGSPDRQPGSPNGADDEFDSTSTFASTLGSLDTNSTANSLLYLVKNTSGTQVDGVYKTAPSMPFTMTCRVVGRKGDVNFHWCGLMLLDSTPTALKTYGIYWSTGFKWDVSPWTNRTTRGTATQAAIPSGWSRPDYMQVVATSTSDVKFYISMDGLVWLLVNSGTISFTPGYVGLFISAYAAQSMEAYFDWVRFA